MFDIFNDVLYAILGIKSFDVKSFLGESRRDVIYANLVFLTSAGFFLASILVAILRQMQAGASNIMVAPTGRPPSGPVQAPAPTPAQQAQSNPQGGSQGDSQIISGFLIAIPALVASAQRLWGVIRNKIENGKAAGYPNKEDSTGPSENNLNNDKSVQSAAVVHLNEIDSTGPSENNQNNEKGEKTAEDISELLDSVRSIHNAIGSFKCKALDEAGLERKLQPILASMQHKGTCRVDDLINKINNNHPTSDVIPGLLRRIAGLLEEIKQRSAARIINTHNYGSTSDSYSDVLGQVVEILKKNNELLSSITSADKPINGSSSESNNNISTINGRLYSILNKYVYVHIRNHKFVSMILYFVLYLASGKLIFNFHFNSEELLDIIIVVLFYMLSVMAAVCLLAARAKDRYLRGITVSFLILSFNVGAVYSFYDSEKSKSFSSLDLYLCQMVHSGYCGEFRPISYILSKNYILNKNDPLMIGNASKFGNFVKYDASFEQSENYNTNNAVLSYRLSSSPSFVIINDLKMGESERQDTYFRPLDEYVEQEKKYKDMRDLFVPLIVSFLVVVAFNIGSLLFVMLAKGSVDDDTLKDIADETYMLGFLLTLTGMVSALYGYKLDEYEVTQAISKCGGAISSTLAAVLFRSIEFHLHPEKKKK